MEIIDFDPKGKFHPDIEKQFVECDDTVEQHFKYKEDGTFYKKEKSQEEVDAEKLEKIRIERNNLLSESDFIIQRHVEQKELVMLEIIEATTITEEKYNEWLEYRQLLRDMTIDIDLDDPLYPAKPE